MHKASHESRYPAHNFLSPHTNVWIWTHAFLFPEVLGGFIWAFCWVGFGVFFVGRVGVFVLFDCFSGLVCATVFC